MAVVRAKSPAEFATEADVWNGHLVPAPAALQERARAYYENLVQHYGRTVEEIGRQEPSLARSREQADARFMRRLRELCVAALTDGAGLLVVDGRSRFPSGTDC